MKRVAAANNAELAKIKGRTPHATLAQPDPERAADDKDGDEESGAEKARKCDQLIKAYMAQDPVQDRQTYDRAVTRVLAEQRRHNPPGDQSVK